MVEVSVVVATWNRADRLARLVAALEAQAGAPPFEVVLVDDGSTDDTPSVLAALVARSPLPIRVVRLDANRGPAAARNAGWRAATAEAIAFTDDDCWPEPGWLAALVAGLATADVVQGRTLPDPDAAHRDWFSHTVEILSERGFYETCNIAYRRRWLEQAGGFDEAFRSSGSRSGPIFGEDTDLAWRVKEQGATTAFRDDAVVTHEVRPGNLLDRLRSLRRREGVVMLVRRHPELRASFPGGWWYQEPHGPVLLLALGVVVVLTGLGSPVRWAVGALLACPYLWVRTRGLPLRYRLVMLPRMLAFDLGEVAVLAWASAKHRTLVL